MCLLFSVSAHFNVNISLPWCLPPDDLPTDGTKRPLKLGAKNPSCLTHLVSGRTLTHTTCLYAGHTNLDAIQTPLCLRDHTSICGNPLGVGQIRRHKWLSIGDEAIQQALRSCQGCKLVLTFLFEIVSCPWVLGMKHWSRGRAASAFNFRAISPAFYPIFGVQNLEFTDWLANEL